MCSSDLHRRLDDDRDESLMLNPFAIAVQGIGFTPPVVAVQGITTAAVPGSGSQQGGGFIVNMGRLMSR